MTDGSSGDGMADGSDAGVTTPPAAGRPVQLAAFEAFYRRHEDDVYRTVLGIVHDGTIAEEVVCDTFLRAHRFWDSFDPDRSPLPWLQRVAINLAITRLRRRRLPVEPLDACRARELSEAGDPAQQVDAAARAELQETVLAIRQVLGRLSPELRAVVVLRYVDDYSVTEIAALLDRPASTIKHRLRSALRQIREELHDDDAVRAPAHPALADGPLEP